MAQTIPSGSQSSPFTATTSDTYTLNAGETRTQTAGIGVQTTTATGPITLDIEETLNNTAAGQIALATNNPGGGQIFVGPNGLVRSLNGNTIVEQSANATVNLTNLGQIVAGTAAFTPSVGGTNPGTAFALNYNAARGTSGAPATDFTSGGIIQNGATTNAAALIRSDNGDAIRLGSHQTLVNYGQIIAAGPVNDSSSNNQFNGANGNPNTSVATTYDISRGVRLNQNGATSVTVENHNLIQGAQHGVDVGQTNITGVIVNNLAGATILGKNGSGVGSDTTGAAANTVTVNNFGTIRGEYAPAYDRAGYATVDGDGDGVDVDGAATVNNYAGGLIAGSGANGNLTGRGAGGFDSNGRANRSEGLSLGGGKVTNDGTISGADTGIVVNNDANADGSRSGVTATSIVNGASGQIVGRNGYAIRLENKTGNAATDNDTIVNAGTIVGNGTIPSGTVLRQDGTPDAATVGTLDGTTYTAANAGSARFISGDGSAIQTGEGADTLSHYGTITGNTGRALNLEGGDDTLNLYTGSTVNGRLDGGAGTDTLNLRLDDRPATAPGGLGSLGANSGITTGTLANVVNFERLSVQGGNWTIQDAQTYTAGIAIGSGAGLTLGASGSLAGGGPITFATTTGTATARLTLATGAQPNGVTFANAIGSFGAGSQLDLQGLTNASVSYNSSNSVLTVTGTSGGSAVTQNYTFSNPAATTFTAQGDGNGGTLITICFATGTRIRTRRGEVAVEALRVGDEAVTASGAMRPIVWIGHRDLSAEESLPVHQQPVRVRAGAFGQGLPARDLFLSPGHPVLVGADADNEGGVLVPVMCLINGTTIARAPRAHVTYWHVELDAHDILLAEGLPAESYHDLGSRGWFAGEHGVLADPDLLLAGEPGRCRPVALDGVVVEAQRQRLGAVFAAALDDQSAWSGAPAFWLVA